LLTDEGFSVLNFFELQFLGQCDLLLHASLIHLI
jgi:hypothetical protein